MGVIDRVSRLVRANVNDLLDQAEDPVQGLLHGSNPVLGNLDPGELGDAVDVVSGQHAKSALRP